ncbi:MAG: DUF3575 domain-containing protein [bacterium]|nr:DUF3575 domain-containing protein [bacterium]
MRKRYLVLILAFILCTLPVLLLGEEISKENPAQFTVTFYPMGLIIGYYSFEAEYKLSPNLGLPVEIKYLSWDLDDWKFSAFSGGPGIRYYPAKEGLTGLFAGLYLNYMSATVKYSYLDNYVAKETEGSASGLAFNMWFGYKMISGPILVEVSTGVALSMIGDVKVEYTDAENNKQSKTYSGRAGSGFSWAGLGIGIGLAF